MKYIRLVILLLAMTACKKALVGEDMPNTAENSFDHLWQEYDRMYGTFVVKNINWDSLYTVYRPQVRNGMPDTALFRVMTALLDHLDDDHVFLRAPKNTGIKEYAGGILGRRTFNDYDEDVTAAYISDVKKPHPDLEYGFLPGNIGYINIIAFESNYSSYPAAMDEILAGLKDTRGIIVDVRGNLGGEDRVAQYIANRFATEKHLSFSAKLRNGPQHTDFAAPMLFYTQPQGDYQYTKPVMLLTRRYTYSSGETFVLAMQQNSNVTTVGDSTGGAFSDAVERELPNGWIFRVPIADVRAADGRNYESIGLAPDVLVQNKRADLDQGKDEALEKAIDLLK